MLPPPWLVAVALLLVGSGIAWTTSAVTAEERVAGVRQADAWREEASFSYVVPVEGEEPRPMGEPGYFTTRAPRVPLAFAWSAHDPRAAPLEGEAAMELVVRASAGGKEAWTLRLPYDARELRDAEVRLEGVLDFAKAEAAIEAKRLESGKRNETLAWSVEATVAYVRDGAASQSLFAMPVAYDPPLFVLPGADAASHTRHHARNEAWEEVRSAGLGGLERDPRGPVAIAGGLAMLAVAAIRTRTVREASA